VRRRAILSVTANPNCKSREEAELVVNQVWESCWPDTRPFDEVRFELSLPCPFSTIPRTSHWKSHLTNFSSPRKNRSTNYRLFHRYSYPSLLLYSFHVHLHIAYLHLQSPHLTLFHSEFEYTFSPFSRVKRPSWPEKVNEGCLGSLGNLPRKRKCWLGHEGEDEGEGPCKEEQSENQVSSRTPHHLLRSMTHDGSLEFLDRSSGSTRDWMTRSAVRESTDLPNYFELLLCLVQFSRESPILLVYVLRDEFKPLRVNRSAVGDQTKEVQEMRIGAKVVRDLSERFLECRSDGELPDVKTSIPSYLQRSVGGSSPEEESSRNFLHGSGLSHLPPPDIPLPARVVTV